MQRARGRLIPIFAIALVLETIVGKEGVPKLRIFRFIGKGRPLSVWEISAFLKKEGILPSFHDFWDALFRTLIPLPTPGLLRYSIAVWRSP